MPDSLETQDRIGPTMTESHFVLSIAEILLEILEYLSVKELGVAASVCKAWLGPAVDTRWRVQKIRLSRLLAKLAPVKKSQLDHTILAPKAHITQDQWSRFLEQYANRVTRLVYDAKSDQTSIKLISTLLERLGGQFGSNITSLTWSYATCKLIGLLHGTKLQEVNLPPNRNAFPIETLTLPQLAHQAPQISKLDTNGIPSSFDFSVFSQLRSLSHDGRLSTSDYHNLTHFTHLQDLNLGYTEMQVTSEKEIDEVGTNFPRLEKLRLYCVNEQAENVIQRSAMPVLRFLLLRRLDTIGEFTLSLLNSILRTSPLLETISFKAAIPPSILKLVQHDGVRILTFDNSYRLRSESKTRNPLDLSIIGRAFPKLERLCIISGRDDSPCGFRTSWHLDALSVVAGHFHNLQRLVLSLYVPISSLSTTPKETTALLSLTDLQFYVLYIALADIDPFVSYLARLCPNILNIVVGILRELSRDREDARLGDGAAFVRRFFDYKDGLKGLRVSDPFEESR
ncbi:hypothetical protein FRB94_002350 [Tulasnella sp. JGI-2019a]|nr:hypothetical protein FRB94_002350 [Tulasnella sp. JGI-2019a]